MNSTLMISEQAKALPVADGLPWVGALPHVILQQFAFLRQAHEQHGDIFRLKLGVIDLVLLNHPDHVQHVLRDNAKNYRKGGSMWDSARRLFGNGLVTSEGDFWLRQRRMMQPRFHRRSINALFELMLSAIDERMATWPERTDSIDLLPLFNNLTMDVIVQTMFGVQFSGDELAKIGESLQIIFDGLMVGMIGQELPSWLPLPGRRKFQQALEYFDGVVFEMIARCRAEKTAVGILPMLLEMEDADTGERMTDAQVRDEVTSIFVAGYETTALAMTWGADFLARNDALQEALGAEVAQVLQGTQPTLASLRDLDLVLRTFKETLRLRPSGWQIPREAVADDVIDGFAVAAGSQMILMMPHVHTHPDVWSDPETFDPDRFLDNIPGGHPFAYAPFGAGQRQCIGRDFALMEGQLILTRLLQRYRLESNLAASPKGKLTSTLRPSGKVDVALWPRG